MSSEQIRLQVPCKFFGVNSYIPQMTRQWIPDCWSGDRKCTDPKGATANSRNWLTVDDIWHSLACCFVPAVFGLMAYKTLIRPTRCIADGDATSSVAGGGGGGEMQQRAESRGLTTGIFNDRIDSEATHRNHRTPVGFHRSRLTVTYSLEAVTHA